MAKRQSAIRIKPEKPVSPLLKPVKLEYAKFFKALYNGVKDLGLHDWNKVVNDVMDGVGAVGLATTPEELTHILLERSITRALFDVVGENGFRTLMEQCSDEKSIDKKIDAAFTSTPVEIDRHFFDRPDSLSVLPVLGENLRTWLLKYGMSPASADAIAKRLPAFFQAAVMQEWRKNSSRYAPILEVLNSPFAKAGDIELGWKNYNAYLQQHIERSVFDEAFSLAQIYVPLNAYYLEPLKDGQVKTDISEGKKEKRRVVVELEKELMHWVEKPHPDDVLRVISGGPGSGKSTFARIFAAHLAQREKPRVLFWSFTRSMPRRTWQARSLAMCRMKEFSPPTLSIPRIRRRVCSSSSTAWMS